MGQKRLTYAVGFGSRVGVVNDYYYPTAQKRLAAGFYMNNGITIHLIENMSISGMVGLGLRDTEGPKWAEFNAVGELNVSI